MNNHDGPTPGLACLLENWYYDYSNHAADTAEPYKPGFILDEEAERHCQEKYNNLHDRDESYNVSCLGVRDPHARLKYLSEHWVERPINTIGRQIE